MCLSFAACGKKKSEAVEKKSEAVENVELLIADLPGLTMENYDEIIAAKKKIDTVKAEYNALTDEEKNQVENKDVFDSQRQRLFESEYTEAALCIQYMNLNIDYVVSGNATIWDNVGASDFWTYQKYVLLLGQNGYDALKSQYSADDAETLLWAAGYAVDKEYFGENFSYFSSSKIAEAEEKCKSYVQSIKNIEDSHKTIEEFINTMMKDYSEEHSKEMDALQTWWIESSMYADHALEPDGNLNSYISAANEYQNNIKRYQKLAGY